jgi:2',3'-cyclic-nucleotide 2'-phosphodiesterase (5'-nucleotidase family)
MQQNDNTDGHTGAFRTNRRRFLGASAAATIFGAAGLDTVAAGSDAITIVHDTHFHGRFEGRDGRTIAEYTTAVREQLAAHDNAVFLGNGDDLSPSLMGLVFKGEHMIEALNYVHDSVDASFVDGAGNHEFDFGVENASQRFGESNFPWVVANLLTPDGNPIPGTERWTTIDVGGVTVGVFGLGVENFHGITAYPDDYQVLHPVDAAAEATAALKAEGADLVVLASHTNHSTHREIAEAVDGLDLIVGSHSGVTFDHVHEHGGTYVSELGDQFKHLGAVTVDVASGDVVDWQRVDVDPGAYDPDPGMQAIVDRWRSTLGEEFGKTVAHSEVELDARFDTNYARESRYGNLLTDIFRAELDADVGIQNPGGIRSNETYGPGAITKEDIYNTLPFRNLLVKLELGGETLKDTLEASIGALPWNSFGIQSAMQISGVQYEYSGHDGDQRVENVYVGGDPLDPDATYTLATNDYVAENWYSLAPATIVEETPRLLADVVVEHLQARGTIAPEIENRILRVDATVGASEAIRRGNSDDVTVVVAKPETAASVADDPAAYRGVTKTGDEIAATGVRVKDDAVEVSFDPVAFPDDYETAHLRVFGEFEPDDAAYGYYRDDGTLYDLPVSATYDHFVLKGPVGEVQNNGTR